MWPLAKTVTVDPQVCQHVTDEAPRLAERHVLDEHQRVVLAVHPCQPLTKPAGARVIGHEQAQEIAVDVLMLEQVADIFLAKRQVEVGREERVHSTIAIAAILGNMGCRARHELHQPAGAFLAAGARLENRFLPYQG